VKEGVHKGATVDKIISTQTGQTGGRMYRRAKGLSTKWRCTERETSVSVTVRHLQGMFFLCGLECRISHTSLGNWGQVDQ